MKKYFKYIAILLSFVMVFSLSGFAALQTATNVFAADSPSAGDNSGTGSDSPSAGDNTGDNTGSGSPSAGDNTGDNTGSDSPSGGDNTGDNEGDLKVDDLEYEINPDGQTITITKYTGSYNSTINVPAEINGKKVTTIGTRAFEKAWGCRIYISEGVTTIKAGAFYCSQASQIHFPSTIEVVEDEAFFTQTIRTVVYGYRGNIIEKVASVDLDWNYCVFYAVDIPDPVFNGLSYKINEDDTISITGYVGSETEIVIPSEIEGRRVTDIGRYAFYASELTKVTIETGIESISKYAFYRSTSLTDINIPNSVVNIGLGAFAGCGKIKKLVIPDSVVICDNDAFNISNYGRELTAGPIGSECDIEYGWTEKLPDAAFCNTPNLVEVWIADSVTSIGEHAFSACYQLKKIHLPDNLKEISRYAFNLCPIEQITIPAGVDRLNEKTFDSCDKLTSVTILGGATIINDSAFDNCTSLTTIYGLTGSDAERFAKENNIIFESIGVYEKPTEPEVPTETPSKPETPIDSDVLDSINSGDKVVTKEVEAGNGSVVPTDFVAAAIAKAAQLVLEVKGTDGNPLVKYTFDGSKFTKAPDASFKLDVACGEKNAVTAKVKEQLNTADENSLFLCDFEHSGELNGELAVTVYPNYDNGTELKLFYYNEATGKAEDMGQTVKVENGEVTFTVTHFSSYLLVKASDIRNDVTPGEPENPSQTEPGNNPSEPETTNPETTPSDTQPETTQGQTETEQASTEPESGNYVAPSTGAGAGSAAALVGVMLMACGAAGVCVGKRKK